MCKPTQKKVDSKTFLKSFLIKILTFYKKATIIRFFQVQSQRKISEDVQAGKGRLAEEVRREQNRAYHALDKVALTMIMMANRFMQARCGIVFVTSGTGTFSVDARMHGCLRAEIPHAILQDRQHFKQLVDHFQLKKCKKPKPRYVDYLDEGVAIFQLTLKPLRGKQAFRRTSAAKVHPNRDTYTEKQRRIYQRVSNGVDICTNQASWLVFRKDEHMPAVEYIVALEGSPEMWSHWAHVTNMIEDFFGRPSYSKQHEHVFKPNGHQMMVPTGSFKRFSMLREDCKMRLVNCVADLAVDQPDKQPFKLMRYPVEDGGKIQSVIQQRSSTLQSKVKIFPFLCLIRLHE